MVVYPPWGLLTGFSQVISMKLRRSLAPGKCWGNVSIRGSRGGTTRIALSFRGEGSLKLGLEARVDLNQGQMGVGGFLCQKSSSA